MRADLSWAPKREVFVRRNLTTAAATFLVLTLAVALIALGTDLGFWTIPVAALLTLGFLLDDLLGWRRWRYERWAIVDGHLHHTDQDGTASIPLDRIDRVFTRFGSRVIVELGSGERMMMRYLPYPAETASQLRALLPSRP